jgi:hypothetical protein
VTAAEDVTESVQEAEEGGMPARPKFEELAVESESASHSRDYAADVREGRGFEAAQLETTGEEQSAPPASSLFQEGIEEQHRDLDVPAFLRRLKF